MNALNTNNVVSLDGFRGQPTKVATQSAASVTAVPNQLLSPKWESSVRSRLERLLQLKSDWDGAGAKRVEAETARYSFGLLQYVWAVNGVAPFIAPTCYGGVQFEWHLSDMDLEIEIVRSHHIRVLLLDARDESEAFFECRHDLSELIRSIEKFQERYESGLDATAAA